MKSFAWALLAVRVAAQVPLIAFGTVELPLTGAHNSAVSIAEVDRVLNSAVGHGDTHVFVIDEVCSSVVCVFASVLVLFVNSMCSSLATRSVPLRHKQRPRILLA